MDKARLHSSRHQSPKSVLSSWCESEDEDESRFAPPTPESGSLPAKEQFKNEEYESCSESSTCTDHSSSSDLLREAFLYQLSETDSDSDDDEDDDDGFFRLQYLCRVFGPPKIPMIGVYDSDTVLSRADREGFHYKDQGASDDLKLLRSENCLPGFLVQQVTTDDEGYEGKQDEESKSHCRRRFSFCHSLK